MGKFNACPSHPTLRIRSLIRVWVLVLALLFNVSSLAFWVRPVSAASIDVASDTMTRHKISTASDHTIAFDTPTGVDADSDTIIVTFDAGFDLSSITITDVDFEVNGTDKLIASSAGAGVWGYSRSGQIITFTAPTDAASGEVSANDTITVRIGSGSGTTWNLSVVDDGGGDNVGQYTSISAVDSSSAIMTLPTTTSCSPKQPTAAPAGPSPRSSHQATLANSPPSPPSTPALSISATLTGVLTLISKSPSLQTGGTTGPSPRLIQQVLLAGTPPSTPLTPTRSLSATMHRVAPMTSKLPKPPTEGTTGRPRRSIQRAMLVHTPPSPPSTLIRFI